MYQSSAYKQNTNSCTDFWIFLRYSKNRNRVCNELNRNLFFMHLYTFFKSPKVICIAFTGNKLKSEKQEKAVEEKQGHLT